MIVVPVAIPGALLPLPDPSDRSTFSARKLEQLRWANNEYSTYSYNLGVASYNNALDAQANAIAVAANAAIVATNTALAASYAGAAPWVSGNTYAQYAVVSSTVNSRLYRKLTTSVGGAVDPSANTTDWAPVTAAAPAQLVTALVQQAVSGGAYDLTNTTLQSAATNILLYSSQFDQATWVKSFMTVSADFTMSPNGNTDADKLIESATTNSHSCQQLIAVASNAQYSYSLEVKAAGRNSIALSLDRDSLGTDLLRATYTLTGNGSTASVVAAGTASGVSATITFLGNGWYLCTLTGTPSSAAGTNLRATVHLVDYASNYAGDGSSGVIVAEGQLETGAAATSRIVTGAASASRAASVIAPQRVVLPLSPSADAWVRVYPGNGIATNVIDPNGQTITGATGVLTGPMVLDNPALGYTLQFVNSTWRFNV